MKLKDVEALNELMIARKLALEEVGEVGGDLLRRMRHDFDLSPMEHSKVLDELHTVEKAFVELGNAEYMSAYLNYVGFTYTEELPDPMIAAKPKSSQAMLTFMQELRGLGFDSNDINAITADLKKYTLALRDFGAVNMELQVATPKDDRNAVTL